MRNRLIKIFVLLAIVFASVSAPNAHAAQTSYANDEVIVKFKSGAHTNKFLDKHAAKVEKRNEKLKISKIKLPKGVNIKDKLLEIKNDPNVEYAEPNYYYYINVIPNDTYYNLQWSIPKMKVDKAWDTSLNNSSITIAVVDTGVDSDHPDLAANLVPGYNTINNTTNTNDDQGHGTHVAGIAAGITGNGKGIAGVSGTSKIMPVKVMNSSGSGSISDICEGIVWAADHGAKVINLSLGGPYYTQSFQDAVDYAYNKGAIVIAAAGNDNTSSPSYPAALNHVVGVSAIDENNNKAWFSNYGTYVDLASPGTNIYSSTFDGLYGYKQGTSMACPNVSGVAALIWSQDTSLTPAQLENILKTTSVDLGATGRDDYFGYGLVDAYSAILAVNPEPSLPAKGNIESPKSLQTLSETFTVKGWFLDGEGVDKLEVMIDGNVIGEAEYGDIRTDIGSIFPQYNNNNCGFHYSLDTTKLTSGNHSLTVRETSKTGRQTTLNGTAVIISNNLPPIGYLENPSGLETLSGIYKVKGWFLDESVVSKIEILIDGEVFGEATYGDLRADISSKYPAYGNNNCGFYFDLDTTLISNGSHTINIRETSKTGLQKTLIETPITISNTVSLPPQGTLEQPQWLELITGTYTLKGWFLDGNTVSKIEIMIDGQIIGEAIYGDPRPDIYSKFPGYKNNNSGFHYTFDTAKLSEGDHTITIRETALNGNQKTLVGTLVTVIKSSLPQKSKAITIYYNLSEASSVTISIFDSSNNLVKTLEKDVSKAKGLNSSTWDGKNSSGVIVGDGIYTYKITAVDLAGLTATPITGTITIERLNPSITSISDSPDPFIPNGSSVNTIKYTLSENANVVIMLYDGQNNNIKTLINGPASAGNNSAVWDGTNESGTKIADGTYTYRINATDAFYKKAIPVSGTILTDGTPPKITANNISPEIFSPSGINMANISYSLSENAKVTIQIYDNSNNLIYTLEDNSPKPSGINSTGWDGRNSSRNIVKDGIYTYTITAVDFVGLSSSPMSRTFTVDGSAPVINLISAEPDPFIPSKTSANIVTYTLSEDAKVIIKIYNPNNNLIKTLLDGSIKAGNNTTSWDGTNSSGSQVSSGSYTYKLDATDALNKKTTQVSKTIMLDTTSPVIDMNQVNPNPFEPMGANYTAISFNLSEKALASLSIYDQSNNLIRTLEDKTLKTSGTISVNWDGKDSYGNIVTDGIYTYKIDAEDLAGLSAQAVTGTITIERSLPSISLLNVSPNPFQPTGSTICTIKYSLSENANVKVNVYDDINTLIKTVSDKSMSAGTNSITWDGTDNSGSIVKDGIYTCKINAADSFNKNSGVISATITVDSHAPVISANILSSSTFSPINDETTTIFYNLSENAKTTVTIYDVNGNIVDTIQNNILKAPGTNSTVWDGSNSSGVIVKEGTYKYKITAMDLVGLSATPVSGTITINHTSPIITSVSDSPDPFKPDNKNVNTIKFTLSRNLKVSVKIFDSNKILVKTLINRPLTQGAKTLTWDGTNDSGALVKNGIYTYQITAFSATDKIADQVLGIITADLAAPQISINSVSPNPFAPLGDNTAVLSFNLSESAKTTITIYDSSNNMVKTLESNKIRPEGINSIEWNGTNSSGYIVKDGSYRYKISAADLVGLSAQPISGSITLLHNAPVITSVSASPDPFNPKDKIINTIKYALSEDANVKINIYDSNNNLVKTLINSPVSAGSNSAAWDGTNNSNSIVNEGIYTYKINAANKFNKMAEEVSDNITVDLTPPIIIVNSINPSSFAPTGNNTVSINYSLSENAKTTINIYNSANILIRTLENNALKPAGANSAEWDGKDSLGSIVKEGNYIFKINAVDLVGFHASPATGSIGVDFDLTITAVTDTPDPFKSNDTNFATINYTLSKNANVIIKIYFGSNILVRTLLNSTVTAGNNSITWNGKNDSGALLSSNIYTYKISAADGSGKTAVPVSGTITVDHTPPVISTNTVTPNPFVPKDNSKATISYTLSEKAVVTTAIFDGSNNCIRTLESSVLKSTGSNSVDWDGKDSIGMVAIDGVYTYKIIAVDMVNLAAEPATGTITVGNKPEITSISDTPDPFRPTGTNLSTIKFTLSQKANVTIKIIDSNNNVLKTILDTIVNSGDNSITWDGTNVSGSLVGAGIYTYKINAIDNLGRISDPVYGTITIDFTPPEITDHSANPNPFTPKQ